MLAKILLNQPLTQDRYGLHFERGEAQTDNEYLIKKLQKKGVKVEIVEEIKEKKLEEMKVDELKAIAFEKGIEILSTHKKADIIELIKNCENDISDKNEDNSKDESEKI